MLIRTRWQMEASSNSDNALWERMYLRAFGRITFGFQPAATVDWRQVHAEVSKRSRAVQLRFGEDGACSAAAAVVICVHSSLFIRHPPVLLRLCVALCAATNQVSARQLLAGGALFARCCFTAFARHNLTACCLFLTLQRFKHKVSEQQADLDLRVLKAELAAVRAGMQSPAHELPVTFAPDTLRAFCDCAGNELLSPVADVSTFESSNSQLSEQLQQLRAARVAKPG